MTHVSLSLVTAPTQEPIALQEAKEHCRIDLTDEDALVSSYITAARQHVENVTGRQLLTATWALKLDGWPCWIDVPRPPLRSVTTIEYVDTAGTTQTLAADQYRVSGSTDDGDVVTMVRGRITPAYSVTWPTLRCTEENVTVTFSAGYGTSGDAVPMPIRAAMLLLIGHWHEHREHVVIGNITTELPMAVKALIAPYRTWATQRQ